MHAGILDLIRNLDSFVSNPNLQSRSSLSRVKLISSGVGVELLEFEFKPKVFKLKRWLTFKFELNPGSSSRSSSRSSSSPSF
jgi:hypothetical protein